MSEIHGGLPFEQVAAAELAPLRRFAMSLCRDPYQADDLVQGALERMFLAWPRLSGIARPDAYLRKIVVRLMINERRRPWRRERPVEVMPDAGYSSTSRAILGMDLTQALSGLTVKQRAVVVLRYVEDRPVAEVSEILGISQGTVKRQASDAVGHLRKILGDDFGYENNQPGSPFADRSNELHLDRTRGGF